MEKPRKTLSNCDVSLELEMARDEHLRPLSEEMAMRIRFYVERNEKAPDMYRDIQHAVIAVHQSSTGATSMTIGQAIRTLYRNRVVGIPTGEQVAEALRYALH